MKLYNAINEMLFNINQVRNKPPRNYIYVARISAKTWTQKDVIPFGKSELNWRMSWVT